MNWSPITSLDWSKKLKDAGWPQVSPLNTWWIEEGDTHVFWPQVRSTANRKGFAAPTAAEILALLPERISEKKQAGMTADFLRIMPTVDGLWRVYYKNKARKGARCTRYAFESKSLADAAAEMYCLLAQNNLLPH